jgi:hypothetical protein
MASIINASSSGSGGIVQTADASGVLQLQTNGTTALTVSSSQGIGIGTDSPTAQLEISRSATNAYSTMRLSNTGASGKTYEIGVGGNTAASGYANNLYFYDSTAGAIRMAVTSAGYVNMPAQPMFIAAGNQNAYVSVASGANLPLNVANLNTSSSYNTSTYLFTAPVAGRYLFIVAMYMQGGASSALFDFEKNGGTYQRLSFTIPAGDLTYFGQCIMSMSAGDTARVKNSTGSARSMFIATDLHTAFSGYLIG